MYGRGALWRFTAPASAAGLDILVGGKAANVAVADGYAKLPETETRTIPAGAAVSTWRLSDERMVPGPRFDVVPTIAVDGALGGPALKTHAERVEAIEEVLLTAAASGHISFSVGEDSYSFQNREELRTELTRWRQVVRYERGIDDLHRLVATSSDTYYPTKDEAVAAGKAAGEADGIWKVVLVEAML